LDPAGTAFERRVWDALGRIPWGETRTYGEIAAELGQPRAARAVGGANHRNPHALVFPSHRVGGADGSLTGYAAGLRVKSRLLALETRNVGRSPDAQPLFASMEPTATSHTRGRATALPATL
jgi:methylated-DNA-[protein]-cysteine S-methyltransferase